MTIFKSKSAVVSRFRQQFARTPNLAPLCSVDDDMLYYKVLGAENMLSQRLRVFFEPTKVFCSDTDNTQAIAALAISNPDMPYVEDPGYTYNPDFFRDNTWGFQRVNHIPIIEVESFSFVMVNANVSQFTVPKEWIRLYKKYGHIQLLPYGDSATLPLSAYLLSVFGGGRTIPNMIRIVYTGGIQDIFKQYPGLVDLIYQTAAYSMIMDGFPGGSESISMDGLSQSQSFDIKAYNDPTTGALELSFRRWMDILHGVRVGVV